MSESSWNWSDLHTGLRVVDVAGRVLGRVRDADPTTDHIDVTLRERIARKFDAPGRIVAIPFGDIVDADDHEVTLSEEAPFILHPERRPDPHDSAF